MKVAPTRPPHHARSPGSDTGTVETQEEAQRLTSALGQEGQKRVKRGGRVNVLFLEPSSSDNTPPLFTLLVSIPEVQSRAAGSVARSQLWGTPRQIFHSRGRSGAVQKSGWPPISAIQSCAVPRRSFFGASIPRRISIKRMS